MTELIRNHCPHCLEPLLDADWTPTPGCDTWHALAGIRLAAHVVTAVREAGEELARADAHAAATEAGGEGDLHQPVGDDLEQS